jgi:hypothetical protein
MTHIRPEMTTKRLPLGIMGICPSVLQMANCTIPVTLSGFLDTAIKVGWSTIACKTEKVASPVEQRVRQARMN